MDSIRTISCKLRVTDDQTAHIEATLQAFADACNFVADYGRTHRISRQYTLHKACYADVRSRFGLSANLAIRAIARVAPRLSKVRTRNATFRPTSIDYDARIFRFVEEDESVSLTLLNGRVKLSLKMGNFQREALAGYTPTSATLSKTPWSFYQFRQFIAYKAARAGVQVIPVNPAWTSQMCSSCLHIGSRSGERFRCSNCGTVMHADVNGALNIAAVGAVVTRPEYSPLSCPLPQWVADAAG